MNPIRRNIMTFTLLAAFLTACGPGQQNTTEPGKVAPVNIEKRTPTMADGYRGFWREGTPSADLSKTPWLMVFFDPMCPHCLTFWGEAIDTKVPQLWVPINVLRKPQGESIGAWLLETKTPSQDFTSIKTALMDATPFEVYPSKESKAWIADNTQRFNETGQQGVPTLVSFHPARQPKVNNGGLYKADLEVFIGEKQ